MGHLNLHVAEKGYNKSCFLVVSSLDLNLDLNLDPFPLDL